MGPERICQACFVGASIMDTFHNLKKRKELTNIAPEETGIATVLSRRVASANTLSRSKTSWRYLVTFRMENGEEMELQAEEAQFPSLAEGLKMTITWQEENLLSFSLA